MNKKILLISFLFVVFSAFKVQSQYKFGTNVGNPNAIATFYSVDSSKGIVFPHVSTTNRPLASTSKGMVIYNLNDSCIQVSNGLIWESIGVDSMAFLGSNLYLYEGGNVADSVDITPYFTFLRDSLILDSLFLDAISDSITSIDSVRFVNDTLSIYENDSVFSVFISSSYDTLKSLTLTDGGTNDTLTLMSSDSTFTVVLEDLDSMNERIDMVMFSNDTLTIVENDSTFKVLINPSYDTLKSLTLTDGGTNDTLTLMSSDSTFTVVLEDLDSMNELIDSTKLIDTLLVTYEHVNRDTVDLKPLRMNSTYKNVSSAYSISSYEEIIYADVSGGDFTITLPSAVTYDGRKLIIKRTDNTVNVLTINTAGGNIDGIASRTMTAMQGWEIHSNGSDWWILLQR